MKSPRSSLASRYSVAFILCLSCLMIMIASALSVSPNSSLASSTPSNARAGATALPPGGPIARTPATSAALSVVGPALTATKTDNTSVAVDPGATIMYTVVINSTGTVDATNVIFTDTIDANTTLVAGSVKSSPIAFDDAYTASGNIPIAPATSLLANDIDPDTGTNAGLTVTQVQGAAGNVGNPTNTTATGIGGVTGSVTVQANGTFTYEPPPGFTGADTFTYQISDASGKTGSGTVTINISNMVWFIDNTSVAANSRGTFSQPFKTIAAFNAVNSGAAPNPQNGHHVVLRPASGSYAEADGINLRDSQTLTGPAVAFNTVFTADANSTSAYTTFAASTGTAAAITATAGNGVDLGSGNAVRGFNVGNTPAFFGFNGTAVGALTVATVSKTGTGGAMSVSTSGTFGATVNFGTFESTSSASNNLNLVGVTGTLGVSSAGTGFTGSAAASAAINISGGSVSLTYAGNVTKASTGALLSVAGGHTGTLTFNTGTLNASSGTGLQFDNADGTYNFNGTTTLNGGDAGVDILNGSGGTFSFGSGTTITSPSGTAFNVNSSSPSVTYSGSITQNTAGQRVVNIDTTTSNTITFQTGTITGGASSTGININAANGNVTFSNGMTLGTSGSRMTNQAVTITNGGSAATYNLGAVSIFTTGAAAQGIAATTFDGMLNATGVVDASGASAINVVGPAGLTTLTMSFTKVSANGGANGIKLTNCGGSFTITGDSGGSNNGSGGTISAATAEGILINVASNVSLGYLNINNSGTDGINTTGVNGFTLNRCNLTDSAGGAADDGVALTNTSGTVSITNCVITSSPHNGVTVDNNNTNMAGFTFTSNTVSCGAGQPCQPSGSIGNDGLSLSMRGTSVLPNGLVSGSSFSGVRAVGVQVETNDTGRIGANSGAASVFALDGTNSFVVQNNTFTGNGQGVDMNTSQVSNMTFEVLGNTINGIPTASGGNGSATAINAFTAAGAATGPAIHSFVGKIDGNFIGTQGTKDSGSGFGNGIRVVVQGQTTQGDITVSNNTVRECAIANPLNFIGQNGAATSGTATARFKIINNTLPLPSGTNVDVCGTNQVCIDAGIFILADEGTPVCNVITGNNVFDANAFNGTFDVYLAERTGPPAGAQLTVEGTGGSNSAYIIANNTLAGTHQFLDEGSNTSQVALGTCGTFPNAPEEAKALSAAHPQSDVQTTTGPTTNEALTVVSTEAPNEQQVRHLSQAELNWMVEAAIARWELAGISSEDLARLRQATFEVASLPQRQIASASSAHIKIDETAAGYGWFFDQTPNEDSEFDVAVLGKEFQTTQYSPAHGRVDLLTVVMRELGEVYLQAGKRIPKTMRKNLQPLMEATLSPSVRRLPDASLVQLPSPEPPSFTTESQNGPAQDSSQQSGASSTGRRAGRVGTSGNLSPQSVGTVTQALGTIPVNELVTLTFQVTINDPLPPNVCTVTNPAAGSGVNVTGTNFTSVTIAADSATIVKPPTIGTCPTNITKNTDANVCTAVTTFTTPTSDACPAATVTCSPASGFAFVKGTTTVTCTAANGVLPNATCTFTVTVNDAQAPVLSGCTNQTINTAAGVCTATATYAPTATDNCDGSRPVTCVPASGSTFNKGVTTVSCSASDLNTPTPNTGTCTFTITVNDNQAPVLSGCTNQTLNTAPGVCTATATYTPTATDNCDGSRPVTCVPASGSTFTKGVTTVSCSASDLNTPTANTGTCMFTVTVADNQAPILTGCTNITTNTAPGVCTAAPTFTPTATDNCDGSRPVTCVPASGSTFNKGVTTVACSASDLSSNTGNCSFTVTVNDNQAPVLSGCTNQTIDAAAGACTATATYAPTATDNCDGARPVTCVPASGSTFNKGVTTVTCSASDLNTPTPNTGTCMFTITVNDNQPPVVTCPASDGAFAASDCLPSQSSAYTGATLYSVGANTVTNAVLSNFTPCTAPPVSGMATINFTGILTGDLSLGGPPTLFQAPVTGSMKVTFNNLTGSTRTFDTEMLQLDISGGNLPAGVQLRESPTLTSTGQTKITTVTGGFRIDSFFDVFTELSTNSGGSWTPDPTARHIAAVQSTDANACNAVVNYPDATATDNCPGVSAVTCVPASGTTFAKGTTTVTCSATDAATLTGNCSFTVTVVDTQLPTLTCPNNISVTGNVCQVQTYTTPTPSDNCPGSTASCSPASGTCFAVGTTTVTCTATDTSANTNSCTFTVTVTPCTITCPNNVTVPADSGVCTAVATFADPTTTGQCGTVTCVPASGSTFQKGVTTVTCSTTAGPSCSFTVTVNDNEAPTITCPNPVTQNTDPNLCTAVVSFTPTGHDNCPGVTTACVPASGSVFPKGVTTVSCTATDASTNVSAPCTFTVTVVDNQAPTVACPANITKNTDPNLCTAVATYVTPAGSDNCAVQSVVCSPASGTTFAKGITTVTCTVTDTANLTGTCTFTVTVVDNQAPTVACPAPITQNTNPGVCTSAVTYTTPTGSDNCPLPPNPVVCSPASGSAFAKGITTVTCTVTDAANLTGHCTFTVTVNDMQNPTVTCPANINFTTPGVNDPCGIVTYATPSGSDNCAIQSVVCSPASGGCFPVGMTTVTCTATDTSGNHGSCSFKITVSNPCTITCPANITKNNDPNQCGAVATFAPTTTGGGCGTVVCTPASGSFFPKGTTTVTCTTSGPSCSFTVTVNDTEGPHITLTTGTIELWPANHNYTTITMSQLVASVTDNCGGNFINNVKITSVSSDEQEDNPGPGDGSTLNDIVIAANCKSVQLRAERDGTLNGRVYTINLKVTDGLGNVSTASRTVVVPLSQSGGGAILGPGPGYTKTSSCP